MSDLGWDIAETQLQRNNYLETTQEIAETNNHHVAVPLQAMIVITILLITILELLNSYIQEVPKIMRKIAQKAKLVVTKIKDAKVIRNVKKKIYREVEQRIRIATRAINHTNHDNDYN